VTLGLLTSGDLLFLTRNANLRQRLLTLKTEMGNSEIKLTTCSANGNERSSTAHYVLLLSHP
jgi:hypothetical protein